VQEAFVIGLDFGTDSVRAVLNNAANGEVMASSTFNFPRWRDGLYCDATKHQFRQHPMDHLEGLTFVVRDVLKRAGGGLHVTAIGIDATGSSPMAVDAQGRSLAMLPGLEHNPNAMVVLWKDHTSAAEATEINEKGGGYLRYAGGIYSSEWFWAKLLHVIRADEAVRRHAYAWVEHSDWLPFVLTGGTDANAIRRNVCAAGHKALWSAQWGGLPPRDWFAALDPRLTGFAERFGPYTWLTSQPSGALSPEWAEKLGLSTSVIVGIGALDAHVGAVGGQIEPYHLSKVMGTSTCDMLVVPQGVLGDKTVRGICGQVEDSIIPGMTGLEAGQSAFGDTYAWFREVLAWPLRLLQVDSGADRLLPELDRLAAAAPFDEHSELAVDWLNGRRTPDANPYLTGAIRGLNLASDAVSVYRALVESTCFGAKKITERFAAEGVDIQGLIGVGGIARKSPYIMQVMADVLDMPIRIHSSDQTCAAGAAMFAAVAAGHYAKVEDAMAAMGQGFDKTYAPDPGRRELYRKRYRAYKRLGDYIESETTMHHEQSS